jgi:hypothetical protein
VRILRESGCSSVEDEEEEADGNRYGDDIEGEEEGKARGKILPEKVEGERDFNSRRETFRVCWTHSHRNIEARTLSF